MPVQAKFRRLAKMDVLSLYYQLVGGLQKIVLPKVWGVPSIPDCTRIQATKYVNMYTHACKNRHLYLTCLILSIWISYKTPFV